MSGAVYSIAEKETVMTRVEDLTPKFRNVRLLLARDKDHPGGDHDEGYDLLVPLDDDHRLDAADWKTHQERCRVRWFRAGEADRIGRLRRKPGGTWYFDYAEGEADDEIGFRFNEERFVTGEYVSVTHGGKAHTYQVARVERP
jgi:hypothetical protein